MKTKLIIAACALAFGVGQFAQAAPDSTKAATESPFAFKIGIANPSGSGVAGQYGGTWIDLGARYKLSPAEPGKLQNNISIEIIGGAKDKDFTPFGVGGTATATAEARVITLGYEGLVHQANGGFYYGGGLAVGFVHNETKYKAPDGTQWNINQSDSYTVGHDQTSFVPSITLGYKFNKASGVELKYSIIHSSLPATDSAFSAFYPSAGPAKLNGLLALTYTING